LHKGSAPHEPAHQRERHHHPNPRTHITSRPLVIRVIRGRIPVPVRRQPPTVLPHSHQGYATQEISAWPPEPPHGIANANPSPAAPAPASSNETGCASSARGHAAATTPSKSTTGSPSQRAAPTTTPTCGPSAPTPATPKRSEEHTSELQSRENLVCRLLHEKKKKIE